MATKLEKDVTRESTVLSDDRNIMVTITKNQEISFKLKGMKSGEVKISIEELYAQLTGAEYEAPKKSLEIKHDEPAKTVKRKKGDPCINLHDFRSAYLTAGKDEIPYDTKVKLESITSNLLKDK